jgi:protein-tyrosine phosphatase
MTTIPDLHHHDGHRGLEQPGPLGAIDGGARSVGAVSEPAAPHRETVVLLDHPDRRVTLTGAFNVRDLGGYPADGGRTVRWRTLYRADALHRLEDDELDVLGARGIRAVLDLRTATEVEKGRVHADHLGMVHHHLPVLDDTWSPEDLDPDADAGEILGSLYIQMLAIGAPALGGALRLLAAGDQVPAVFHCAAGKDRTGVLAALVLGLLGVPDDVIVADYALTASAMERLMDRLRTDSPEAFTTMTDQPEAYLAAPPAAMERFLGHVHATYGSVAGYAETVGCDPDAVERLRATLLEG